MGPVLIDITVVLSSLFANAVLQLHFTVQPALVICIGEETSLEMCILCVLSTLICVGTFLFSLFVERTVCLYPVASGIPVV